MRGKRSWGLKEPLLGNYYNNTEQNHRMYMLCSCLSLARLFTSVIVYKCRNCRAEKTKVGTRPFANFSDQQSPTYLILNHDMVSKNKSCMDALGQYHLCYRQGFLSTPLLKEFLGSEVD